MSKSKARKAKDALKRRRGQREVRKFEFLRASMALAGLPLPIRVQGQVYLTIQFSEISMYPMRVLRALHITWYIAAQENSATTYRLDLIKMRDPAREETHHEHLLTTKVKQP